LFGVFVRTKQLDFLSAGGYGVAHPPGCALYKYHSESSSLSDLLVQIGVDSRSVLKKMFELEDA
jgi:hypothetical protein